MKIACIYHRIDLDGWMSAAIVKMWFDTTQGDKTMWLIENLKKSKKWLCSDNSWTDNPNHDLLIKCKTKHCADGVADDFGVIHIRPIKYVYDSTHNITYIGYTYGDPIPDLSEYNKIIMCDVSFPKEEMSHLDLYFGSNFIYIDHHISAIKQLPDGFTAKGIRNTNFAACELTWQYFYPTTQIPEIVRLLGLYDSFRHEQTGEKQKVLEFQYGARACISGYEQAYDMLSNSLISKSNVVESIHIDGAAIYRYLCVIAKQIYDRGFEILFFENSGGDKTIGEECKKFLCINAERFNPINFAINYHEDGYDGVASFYRAGNRWEFSLYNGDGTVDCSILAKQFGGGGHKGAAGFICDDKMLLGIINKRNI